MPPPSFDNLPSPRAPPKKAPRIPREQPPSYVSHQSLKEFYEKKERQEKEKQLQRQHKKEEAAKRKSEKEATKKAEQERKRLEREKRKAEKLALKQKGKGKRRKEREVVLSETESEGEVVLDDDSSCPPDIDDSFCYGYACCSNREYNGWIGCDQCQRWYHKKSSGSQRDTIEALDEEQLNE